ncbi:peptidoglycan-binding protein [Frigidibacter sp. SD6-1]|uniref:peptidoglycan-binding domain-containing protein n=1 Tax=Frigidibacter sp. SD6-1 TaxID=3032581 RepID=UPI0024DFD15B|nr:peptidoglycan-binding protein [Frigidibacter sp. SD6-1]
MNWQPTRVANVSASPQGIEVFMPFLKPSCLFMALAMGPAWGQDAALVIGNEKYWAGDDVARAGDVLDVVTALNASGFLVTSGSDATAASLHRLFADYYRNSASEGSSVILLAGHFAHAGEESWLLGRDADGPTLASIGDEGLSLSTVLAAAAEHPGAALLLIATEGGSVDLGRGLTQGLGRIDPPQGVTVMTGNVAAIARLADQISSRRGESIAALTRGAKGVVVSGYVSDRHVFQRPDGAAPAKTDAEASLGAETKLWAATKALDTRQAYQSFLDSHPDGLFADDARTALQLLDDPLARAAAEEDALRLSRDKRRQIQQNLLLLDFDPRGIDGLFGPGTRAAIKSWQKRNDLSATGYLTGQQVTTLAGQAARRASELEAEAAARKAEQDASDRAFWDSTGAAGDEAGLRAYLKRYPDGLFAELAQERLKPFDDERRRQAQAADRAAWDRAVAINTVQGYQDYLAAYPKGAFAADAKLLIERQGPSPADQQRIEAAAAAEDGLGLTPFIKRVIEDRLDALQLNPGNVDGIVDEDTRRALRRYQKSRGLPVSGFLNQQTVARLMVDSL